MLHSSKAKPQTNISAVSLCPSHGMAFGTSVMTIEGELPVEFLTPGDRILTRSGVHRLVEIEVTVMQNARVLRIAKDSLGGDRPDGDTYVAPGQPLLIRDWRAKALYGADQALVPASRLADGDYIRPVTLSELRLFTLRFEADVVIYAGGLELACTAVKIDA